MGIATSQSFSTLLPKSSILANFWQYAVELMVIKAAIASSISLRDFIVFSRGLIDSIWNFMDSCTNFPFRTEKE
jgi:hypothetical protein